MNSKCSENCPSKLVVVSLASHWYISVLQMLTCNRVAIQTGGNFQGVTGASEHVVTLDPSRTDHKRIGVSAVDAAELFFPLLLKCLFFSARSTGRISRVSSDHVLVTLVFYSFYSSASRIVRRA